MIDKVYALGYSGHQLIPHAHPFVPPNEAP
jgi:hypothetical protein